MINSISWDPLDAKMDQELVSASAKRSIKNILKSYVGNFDPFAELIQNAMDAVERKEETLKSENPGTAYTKRLWLSIDIQQNLFTIVDNGVGFKEQEFKSFLAPSISFKDSKKNRGNKGVGATYIAYGFNSLELATKTRDFQFSGEIKNGREWVEDMDGVISRPMIQGKEIDNEVFESLESGSFFRLSFKGPHIRPKDLSWYQASTADQWLFFLLTKTPLGGIDLARQPSPAILFSLEVVDRNGHRTSVDSSALYKYPHMVISASRDLQEIRSEQERLLARGADVSKLPQKYSKLNAIYDYYGPDKLKRLPTTKIEDAERSLIDRYNVTAYGYFCYSTNVWDSLNDDIAKLRKGLRVLRGGIQLANNSMVQGDLLVIPLTQSIGYQNQAHVIVHFINADPDLGRKGFQPELKELAENIAIGIVNELKGWRHLLKQDKGNRPDISREMDLHEWVKKEEDFEKLHPLSIINPNFFKPTNEISISSEPQTEQDVIVLFSQLLAGGVIRGIKLLSTSQFMQYDGLYKFIVQEPQENHIFDPNKNPLGLLLENFRPLANSKPRVLEYKYNLDALIHEFENGEKQERDVTLLIAWMTGEEWRRNYEVTSLLDLDNLHHRQFHGITHVFHTSTGTQFDAIILSELILYLNDIQSVQGLQKSKYSEY